MPDTDFKQCPYLPLTVQVPLSLLDRTTSVADKPTCQTGSVAKPSLALDSTQN